MAIIPPLILPLDLLFLNHRIAHQQTAVQIFLVHIYSGNLMIVISRIIVNTFIRIAAAGIKGNFIVTLPHITASSLLVNGAQNMKELADAFLLRISGNRIHFDKCAPYKTGHGG